MTIEVRWEFNGQEANRLVRADSDEEAIETCRREIAYPELPEDSKYCPPVSAFWITQHWS
jgi:hypothetical protein